MNQSNGESGLSKPEIAKELGVSVASVYNVLKVKPSDGLQLDMPISIQ